MITCKECDILLGHIARRDKRIAQLIREKQELTDSVVFLEGMNGCPSCDRLDERCVDLGCPEDREKTGTKPKPIGYGNVRLCQRCKRMPYVGDNGLCFDCDCVLEALKLKGCIDE